MSRPSYVNNMPMYLMVELQTVVLSFHYECFKIKQKSFVKPSYGMKSPYIFGLRVLEKLVLFSVVYNGLLPCIQFNSNFYVPS